MIITIDGPVGTGKSTIAKLLAQKLRFIYYDTGAMYRCITYAVLKKKIPFSNTKQILKLLDCFTFAVNMVEASPHYFFEEEDITVKIRGTAVTTVVSEISAIKDVREKLVSIQRQLGKDQNAVFEGRDMGTVVFPKAEIKFFLTARSDIRAKRRLDDLKRQFPDTAETFCFDSVLESINKRDLQDSKRKVSPLRQAEDAFVIDTSDLTTDQVLKKLITIKESVES